MSLLGPASSLDIGSKILSFGSKIPLFLQKQDDGLPKALSYSGPVSSLDVGLGNRLPFKTLNCAEL